MARASDKPGWGSAEWPAWKLSREKFHVHAYVASRTLKLNHARNTYEEGTASYIRIYSAGVYKRCALSDRFAASLMTRNHGTVMSLSYDALCPGGEDAWGRKRGSDAKTRKARDILEGERTENPSSYVTPTGVTVASSLSSHLGSLPTRNLRAYSKSRFLARRSLCSSLHCALSTVYTYELNLSFSFSVMFLSSFMQILILSFIALRSSSIFSPPPPPHDLPLISASLEIIMKHLKYYV